MQKVCIVGGGLVGSLLSVLLSNRGFEVDVWERRPDMRTGAIQGGRSINLALSTRGFKALAVVGLEEEVKKVCIPMHGRMVHDEQGNTSFMRYGKEGQFINSVSRGGLNQLMLEKADKAGHVHLYFDERCDEINYPKGEAHFYNTVSGKSTVKQYDLIFGTDGAFSAARQSLMKTDRLNFEYSQSYLNHGYKELTMPPANGGGWRMEKECLHIWPRKSFMLIALPNLDGSFTCTLFLAFKGDVSFEHLHNDDEIKQFFTRYFPDALENIPGLVEEFKTNPTGSLATFRCYPWNYEGKGLLLGDAAHGIVPFYGQGMNAGFEDCTALNTLMDKYKNDWATIFPEFSKSRKPNTDAIGDLALRNFIEMRDLVADPDFVLKNKIDKKLAMLFPDKWIPLYTMVSFSEIPYSDALHTGKHHDHILQTIVSHEKHIADILDTPDCVKILEGYLG